MSSRSCGVMNRLLWDRIRLSNTSPTAIWGAPIAAEWWSIVGAGAAGRRRVVQSVLCERDAVCRQEIGKGFPDEEGIFLLAQAGQRIKPLQLQIDESGMTHDHAAVRKLVEKCREQGREGRIRVKVVGPGKGRVGGDPIFGSAGAKAVAEDIEE